MPVKPGYQGAGNDGGAAGRKTVFFGRNRHVLFAAFLVLSVLRPADAENSARYMGILVGLLVLGVFLYQNLIWGQWRYWWENYKTEASAFLGFGGVLVLSAAIHRRAYPDFASFVFYGGSTVFVMALLPMAYAVFHGASGIAGGFSRQGRDEDPWPGFAALILVHGLGICFFFLGDQLQPLYAWTVARGALVGRTKSILNHYNVYGVLSALSFLYCTAVMLSAKRRGSVFTLALAAGLMSIVGGLMSSSRNFVWTLFVGLLVLGFQRVKTRLHIFYGIGFITLFAILFHVVILQVPALGKRFEPFLPYIAKIHDHKPLAVKDFVPKMAETELDERYRLWSRAMDLWQESPWMGIGPGVFRLENRMKNELNVHNIYLQVLAEAGILGSTLFLALAGLLIRRLRWNPGFPVFTALLACLVFDNFIDYSMPFVICTAYFLALHAPAVKRGKC